VDVGRSPSHDAVTSGEASGMTSFRGSGRLL
jgi:hypothetical protein